MIPSLKARGKTIFLTTHYTDEAYHPAERICVIHRGVIVAEGSPGELIDRYGGGNTLAVRECGIAGRFLIEALPRSTSDGRDVLIPLPGSDGTATILRAAAILEAGHVHYKELYVMRPTPDDVFLNPTGEKLAGRDA
jgi:ABC-2 type transport system ATP-binding protein